ncbi:uncharacterized protein LOC120702019 [Panicum virgatum]|uniref:uncharacterized protein LOC120702019 n=1 Tax=Panicum virgatum TaxID=38727 RepID=UPI0019D500F6|nr:uncharacterized protein LOC120702019 [Panicum virgatum]
MHAPCSCYHFSSWHEPPRPRLRAPCHSDDLHTLWAFAENLTAAAAAALRTAWSSSPAASRCAWDNAVCDAVGRVASLRLPANGLSSPLQPAPLAGLARLRDLESSTSAATRLRGPSPRSSPPCPPALRAANLSSNLLHSALPDLAALPAL